MTFLLCALCHQPSVKIFSVYNGVAKTKCFHCGVKNEGETKRPKFTVEVIKQ